MQAVIGSKGFAKSWCKFAPTGACYGLLHLHLYWQA